MSAFSEKIAQRKRGFYRVADFDTMKEVTHTIAYFIEDQLMFEKEKDILVFEDTGKQLDVNTTNGEKLIELFGPEPNEWAGQRVTLYLTTYGRENKPCIRLKSPLDTSRQAAATTTSKSAGGNGTMKEETTRAAVALPEPSDDEESIPF